MIFPKLFREELLGFFQFRVDLWPCNTVQCGICYDNVHLSVCLSVRHSHESHSNDCRYRDILCTTQ